MTAAVVLLLAFWVISFALLTLAHPPLLTRAHPPFPASRRGIASYMGAECEGKTMANGEKYSRTAMTCASWHYPPGTFLIVSYQDRHILVTVTDRGPAKRLGREIDLSEIAFARLAPLSLGLLDNVTITPIP